MLLTLALKYYVKNTTSTLRNEIMVFVLEQIKKFGVCDGIPKMLKHRVFYVLAVAVQI